MRNYSLFASSLFILKGLFSIGYRRYVHACRRLSMNYDLVYTPGQQDLMERIKELEKRVQTLECQFDRIDEKNILARHAQSARSIYLEEEVDFEYDGVVV